MRSKVIVATATVALLTAACGGGTATSTTTSPAAEPSSTPATKPTTGALIGPDGGTITSDDGMFSVVIPAGALGTTETVSVEVVSAADVGLEEVPATGAIYSILPDGLEFSVPIEIIRSVPASDLAIEDDEIPFFHVFHSAGEVWEVLSTNTTRDGNTITIVAEATHFSLDVAVQTGEVLGEAVYATLIPGSFEIPVGGEQETIATLGRSVQLMAEEKDLNYNIGYKYSSTGAIIAYLDTSLTNRSSPKGLAVCGEIAGPGTYTATIVSETGKIGAESIIVWLKNSLSEVVENETFSISVTGTAECTAIDLSLVESVLGISSGQLNFQPWPAGPAGVDYTAPFDMEVDIDEGVFVVKQTQKPSNQQTTGPVSPSTGAYMALGGSEFLEVYMGGVCPLADGSGYWIYGVTLGGGEDLAPGATDFFGLTDAETIRSQLQVDLDAGPDSFFERIGVDFDFDLGCDIDEATAMQRAEQMVPSDHEGPLPGDWGGIYYGFMEPSN